MKRIDLVKNIFEKQSFLCVGLDTDVNKIPKHLLELENPMFEFNKAIIDATAQYTIAYKPNLAFYEAEGPDGLKQLDMTVNYIKDNYPEIFVIADAKRGDIGNTAQMYAKSVFQHSRFDAVTLSPYMGKDSVTPFLEYKDKWSILLALTSNPGSQDFEMIIDKNGHYLFERVVKRSMHWGTPVNMMYVVGATQTEYLQKIRDIAPRSFLLVPGVGAQGGSLEEVAKHGMIDECGLIVNSSRGIIYASSEKDFAQAAADAAAELQSQMAILLDKYAQPLNK